MPAGVALLPLRAFLGFTFCFAGLQKLANPNFFRSASPISIQSQLIGAERTSPLHAVVGHLLHVATPVGLTIALGELAIGLGVLAGLFTRIAAAGGMVLALGLFLTVSYHSNPYYTGSDIVFVFAFTPLLIAGAGGVLALDTVIGEVLRRQGPLAGRLAMVDEDRRELVLRGAAAAAVGAVGLVGAGVVAAVARLVGGAGAPAAPASLGGPAPSTTTTTPHSSPTTAAPRPAGTAIGAAQQVPVGGAASFTDPGSGDPALVIQQAAGHFVAYDAVCPHAGCTVGYEAANRLIVCPCHGSEFDPSTGAVRVGPAPRGLGHIAVSEGPDGQLYVT